MLLTADIVVIDGAPCILNALMDITDRARAEEALRESEQRFPRLFHANPLPMSITRLDDGRTWTSTRRRLASRRLHARGDDRADASPSSGCGRARAARGDRPAPARARARPATSR